MDAVAPSDRTILVIDDEEDVVDLITFNLHNAGYRTIQAHDGGEGISLTKLEQPDIIILDLMLPGQNGLQLFKTLQADSRTKDIPVIMLSARAEPADRIAALKLGVDDYVTKPFSPKELLLRIQAILRRLPPRSNDAVLLLGPFHLDRSHLRCYLHGELLNLTPTEFKLLAYMMQNANEIATRETLIEKIWSGGKRSRKLDTHIMRLREKLGDDSDKIENIYGKGYRFATHENDA